MRQNKEQVEVQAPPIQEINKRRSCLKRSCVTGLGCIVLFLVGAFLILRFAIVSKPKELKTVPAAFPESISLYDQDNITNITFFSGKEKNRAIEAAAFIPKLILSPIILALDNTIESEERVDEDGNRVISKNPGWSDFVDYMKAPVSDHRDLVRIEWSSLQAEPDFIEDYFRNALLESRFDVASTTKRSSTVEFHFSNTTIDGILFIEDNPRDTGTDYVSLQVQLPQALDN